MYQCTSNANAKLLKQSMLMWIKTHESGINS